MHSLPQEHLPLTPEARLGSRAPRSETPSLLVSPVAGLPAQVSMCPICVGALRQEDKALPSRGSFSYGEDVTERGGLTSWLPP